MKRSDIDDQHVIDLAQRWHDARFRHPGVMAALVEEGIPPRLAEAKVRHLVRRGFLDYGVSPNCAWPTGKRLEQPHREQRREIAAMSS